MERAMFVIMPDADAERRYYNVWNVSKRHCRIGKVTLKPPKHWRLLPDLSRTLPYPTPVKDDFTFRWPAIYADPGTPAMCRQCIGKACGNAACPSRMTVTCNAQAEATA